jgi:hypothetical protein
MKYYFLHTQQYCTVYSCRTVCALRVFATPGLRVTGRLPLPLVLVRGSKHTWLGIQRRKRRRALVQTGSASGTGTGSARRASASGPLALALVVVAALAIELGAPAPYPTSSQWRVLRQCLRKLERKRREDSEHEEKRQRSPRRGRTRTFSAPHQRVKKVHSMCIKVHSMWPAKLHSMECMEDTECIVCSLAFVTSAYYGETSPSKTAHTSMDMSTFLQRA